MCCVRRPINLEAAIFRVLVYKRNPFYLDYKISKCAFNLLEIELMSSNIERPSRNEITNKTSRLVSSVDLMCVIYHLVRGVTESYWHKTYAIYMKELKLFLSIERTWFLENYLCINFANFISACTFFFKSTHMTRPLRISEILI